MAHLELDCIGLKCPMPIVHISRALKEIEVGDRLTVHADDPAFQADIESFAKMTRHTLVSVTDAGTHRTAILTRVQ